ncbi:MAG: hypothetical protein IJP99_08505 [Methanobrevibacter sp.]|nr:hypothetical protein [Methanobrevibacter sp.]
MRKYIVNNQEVEYLHIDEKPDGTIEIHFEEKFNLINAHMGEIMTRLRDNGLEGVQITKYVHKYKLVVILMRSIDQLTGVLHSLDIPFGCYEVNYEDAIISIDIPDYEKLVSGINPVADEPAEGVLS